MSEIKPLTLVSGCNLGVLISEHPENPNKPHLLRLQKSLISDSAQNLTILTCGKRKGFLDFQNFSCSISLKDFLQTNFLMNQ